MRTGAGLKTLIYDRLMLRPTQAIRLTSWGREVKDEDLLAACAVQARTGPAQPDGLHRKQDATSPPHTACLQCAPPERPASLPVRACAWRRPHYRTPSRSHVSTYAYSPPPGPPMPPASADQCQAGHVALAPPCPALPTPSRACRLDCTQNARVCCGWVDDCTRAQASHPGGALQRGTSMGGRSRPSHPGKSLPPAPQRGDPLSTLNPPLAPQTAPMARIVCHRIWLPDAGKHAAPQCTVHPSRADLCTRHAGPPPTGLPSPELLPRQPFTPLPPFPYPQTPRPPPLAPVGSGAGRHTHCVRGDETRPKDNDHRHAHGRGVCGGGRIRSRQI